MTDISASLKARLALEKAGFRFTHSLGQNFIFDEELLARVAGASGAAEGVNVLEIGPGAGMLTSALADTGANVLSLELDRALESVLEATVGDRDNVRVLFEDAMKADTDALINEYFGSEDYIVCANLPYYITADFITRMLLSKRKPRSLTVMVQSEAADRLLSAPDTEPWCALAATVSFYCEGRRVMDVPRDMFTPPPHVDSALIRLDLRDKKAVADSDAEDFVRFIRAVFLMRRKTMVNNLTSSGRAVRQQAEEALAKNGLDTKVRGEKLSLEQLASVFYTLKESDK